MPGVTRQTGSNSRYTGRAGEYAVTAQLLIRGINVYSPAVDDGADLLCANGCRVQVKTAHLLTFASHAMSYPEGVYKFYFPAFKNVAMNSRASRRAPRVPLRERCDVVVMWGIEENRFWVVPVDILKNTQAIHVGPSKKRAFDKDLPEMQAMVEMGMSQAEIGQHFGIKQCSVGKRLQKARTRRDCESIRFAVAECENAWETIANFGSLDPQMDSTPEGARVREE